MQTETFDVLIIGAGVSGIGMACALKTQCPRKTFAILERRERLGGTWDLFRFPGVRSDSDMHSYAYSFRPWRNFKLLGDGDSIRHYLADTAQAAGVDRHIRYGIRIREAHWSSAEQSWTLMAHEDAQPRTYRCRFLVMATGYYDQDEGYSPAIPGLERFGGQVVHPQHWPAQLDHAGKRVVVIGSGATAVTLVPALARTAARVTMLQRSPGYLLSLPSDDTLARLLCRVLPSRWAFALARRLSIAMANGVYRSARRWPGAMRRLLLGRVRAQLPDGAGMRDFEPRYEPWDQRLCVVADGDLFKQVRAGRAEVITGEIAGFGTDRVRLASGREVEADLVVTATGLKLQTFGGITVRVDGTPYRPGDHLFYKGVLLEGLPNLAWIVGYINASWTLKAEMASSYVCRLLRHMDAHGMGMAAAHDREDCRLDQNIMSALKAGYVQRAGSAIPRQGSKDPWRVTHDQRVDRRLLMDAPIEDGILVLSERCGTQYQGKTPSPASSLATATTP